VIKEKMKKLLSIAIAGGLMLTCFLSFIGITQVVSTIPYKKYYVRWVYDYNMNGIRDSSETEYVKTWNTDGIHIGYNKNVNTDNIMYFVDDSGTIQTVTYDKYDSWNNQWIDYTNQTQGYLTTDEPKYFLLVSSNVKIETRDKVIFEPEPILPIGDMYIDFTTPVDNTQFVATNGDTSNTANQWGNVTIKVQYRLPLKVQTYDGMQTLIQVGIIPYDESGIVPTINDSTFKNVYTNITPGIITEGHDKPWVQIDTKNHAIIQNVCQEFDDGSFAGQIQMVLCFVPIGEKYLYIQFKMPDGQVYTGSVNIIMNEYVDADGNGIDDNTGISHDTAEQGNGIDIDTSGNTTLS
jgi:hypothetical protein